MKFARERVQVICRQLNAWSVRGRESVGNWKQKEGCYITPSEADADEREWKEFDPSRDRWYGPDRHCWFTTCVNVPESFEGKPLWIRIHTGLEDWDDGRNPQFLLFVDGKPVQGLDINHTEALLFEHAEAGKQIRLDLQAYTGTLHSEFRLLADFEEYDERIRALYYDIAVPLWGLSRMEKEDQVSIALETALVETINRLDLRRPYSREFYASVEEASRYLKEEVYEKMGGCSDVVATCIGHTHIDVAWLWTVDQVRQKSCRSFATVLKLMEEYPEYRFMSSQPKLYTFVKERHPDMYEKIRQRVKEGRWEPEGGMWVEADCNLTSGESLVRQFLFGKRFFREEFGVDNKILWLPDVFGYSAALPQIMKKAGIQYFMTTKLAWNEYNKFPYDTLNWEGIDGTSIFTHLITTLGVGQDASNYFTTYNGMLHPDSIMGGWKRYQNKEINNDILIAFGYGDGGGGPTRKMLETSKRMEKGVRGIPKVRQEFAGTYFEELWNRVKDNKRLPTWVGELYFEYHRGTYTSMARNKRSNRKSEFWMMELELLSVLAREYGREYPKAEIDRLWEIILTNQFHDILPGSSIREVYEVTKEEYRDVEESTAKQISECLNRICTEEGGLTVWNTLGFCRNDMAEIGTCAAEAVTDGMHVYPVQRTDEGAVAYIRNIPSKGYITLYPCQEKGKENAFSVQEREDGGVGLETPFYHVEMDATGRMTSLYDKEEKRQVLQEGKFGNDLRVYEDKPLAYSNWNVDIFHQEKSWAVDRVTQMEWIECGPVRATLRIDWEMMGTVIRQKVHFYADTRRIDFETYADWKFSEHFLKVHFPVDIHTDEATYDIQFGNLTRKLHTNTSWDEAKFEVCGHKWADLSEGNYGVSLLNDCKYGYSMKNRVMTLSLIKSGTEPNKTTDQEEHFFTYALYPHRGTWKTADTVEEAMSLNVPVRAVFRGAARERYSFMEVDQKNVVLETIKQAEDGKGIIVRLYEIHNSRSRVTVRIAGKIHTVEETDLLEQPIENRVDVGERQFAFTIKPYEIRTFRIELESVELP